MINAGLYYNSKSFNATVLYNILGKKIFVLGDNLGNQTIYEMPRNSLDLTISKTIFKQTEFKLSVNDVLNATYAFKTEKGFVWLQNQRGTNVALSIQKTF
jgi:hypothetical protein